MKTEQEKLDRIQEYKKALKGAVALVLSDQLPESRVDVLFYHGRSFGDDDPIITYAAELLKEGHVKNILIHGNDGQTVGGNQKYQANAGKAEVARKLDALGIDIDGDVSWSGQDSLNTKVPWAYAHGLLRMQA